MSSDTNLNIPFVDLGNGNLKFAIIRRITAIIARRDEGIGGGRPQKSKSRQIPLHGCYLGDC